jgi:hypothetical protein
LPRKNCWTPAEHAGATPDGMQHFLARARWDRARNPDPPGQIPLTSTRATCGLSWARRPALRGADPYWSRRLQHVVVVAIT